MPLLFATAADGHHEVKLCEAVLKSSRSKGWVKVVWQWAKNFTD